MNNYFLQSKINLMWQLPNTSKSSFLNEKILDWSLLGRFELLFYSLGQISCLLLRSLCASFAAGDGKLCRLFESLSAFFGLFDCSLLLFNLSFFFFHPPFSVFSEEVFSTLKLLVNFSRHLLWREGVVRRLLGCSFLLLLLLCGAF